MPNTLQIPMPLPCESCSSDTILRNHGHFLPCHPYSLTPSPEPELLLQPFSTLCFYLCMCQSSKLEFKTKKARVIFVTPKTLKFCTQRAVCYSAKTTDLESQGLVHVMSQSHVWQQWFPSSYLTCWLSVPSTIKCKIIILNFRILKGPSEIIHMKVLWKTSIMQTNVRQYYYYNILHNVCW